MNVRQRGGADVADIVRMEADPSTCVITTTIAQKRIQRGNHLEPGRQNLLTKCEAPSNRKDTQHILLRVYSHLNCYRFIQTSIRVHRQAIQRVHAYLSTSCTQRRLYNIHIHISYLELQFCLPTNVECSYMCCTRHFYFMLLSIHDIRCECRRSTLFIMQKFKLP